MAKKQGDGDDILLNITVNGREQLKDSRNDAKLLNDELKNGGKNDISQGVKSLRTQLREAKVEAEKLLLAGKGQEPAYAAAAKKVAELKDAQEELNNTYKAFDPDNKFKVFTNIASAGAKAVQGYAGAMAFLGVNSESAQETLVKLQGIMAFSDAINSIADLKDGYKDFLRILGLTKTATTELAATQTAQTEAEVTSTSAVIAAEERVALARVAAADASIAAEVALQAKRSQTTSSTIGLTAAEQANFQAKQVLAIATAELAAAEEALSIATGQAAVSTAGQGAALAGVTVAEEGATVASYGLGAALKAIGIGLIIGAIAYLITNFDNIKKKVVELLPFLGEAGGGFDKITQIVFGVGNAILQFIIAPIKSVIKLIQGDFKGAIEELKKGTDFVANYEKGASDKAAQQAEERRKERIQREIENNERIIKERKALGENTTKLEIENQRRKLQVLDKESKDYEKDRADALTEITVLQNSEYKRQSDLLKAKLKADLDEIAKFREDNQAIIKSEQTNQRAAEIKENDFKFAQELALLNKRRAANKNYAKDLAELNKARKITEGNINEKYDKAYNDFKKANDQVYYSEFEKKEQEIREKADELRKNATAAQLNVIGSIEARAIGQNNEVRDKTNASTIADTALVNAENYNRQSDQDTPEQAKTKIDNLAAARRDAETAAFELKLAQLNGQAEQEENLRAEHEKRLTDINREQADARKEISKLEAENRLKLFDAIGQGASTAADLLGESTLAGKALAIASATISTYAAIAGQLAAFSGIPIPGYAIAQAIATGLVGLANVKKILSVKVPTTKGGGGGGGGGSAPVINSTVLNQDKSGSKDVTQAIQSTKANDKPLKAYITNKDLNEQKENTAYFNSQSTY